MSTCDASGQQLQAGSCMLPIKGDCGTLAAGVLSPFSTASKHKAWPIKDAAVQCSESLQEQHLQAEAVALWPEHGAELCTVAILLWLCMRAVCHRHEDAAV